MFSSTGMSKEVLAWLMCLVRGRAQKATVSTTLKKKPPTFLDDDHDTGFNFGNNPNDSVLMGLDSLIAADDADDVTNPFDFK